MISPDKVTPGYWYVLSLHNVNVEGPYDIVKVDDEGNVWEFQFDYAYGNKQDPFWIFLAPVPDPIGRPEETIKQLKIDLGLPPSASTTEVFRKSLAVAKKTVSEHRE